VIGRQLFAAASWHTYDRTYPLGERRTSGIFAGFRFGVRRQHTGVLVLRETHDRRLLTFQAKSGLFLLPRRRPTDVGVTAELGTPSKTLRRQLAVW
jgi:hypothetical protein